MNTARVHHHKNYDNELDTSAIYKVIKLYYVPPYPPPIEQIKNVRNPSLQPPFWGETPTKIREPSKIL